MLAHKARNKALATAGRGRPRLLSLRESEMSSMSSNMVHRAVECFRAKASGQVVVVLQGGGALGAYQGGVYQALHEAGVQPDLIIGTSIGAINASLIAGNEPQSRLERLREFWSGVEHKHPWPFAPAWTGVSETMSYWSTLLGGLPEFFRVNPAAFLGQQVRLGVENAGYYSTEPLRKTLRDLVDFSLINGGGPRLTVGAAHGPSGPMRHFDNPVDPD